jgi:hypothetical protein
MNVEERIRRGLCRTDCRGEAIAEDIFASSFRIYTIKGNMKGERKVIEFK